MLPMLMKMCKQIGNVSIAINLKFKKCLGLSANNIISSNVFCKILPYLLFFHMDFAQKELSVSTVYILYEYRISVPE